VFDDIIVGGGIVGLSTAYHLVRAGRDVLIVDRADSARATNAAAGVVAALTRRGCSDEWLDLALDAVDYYSTFIGHLEADQSGNTGFERCGQLLVAASQEKVNELNDTVSIFHERLSRIDRTVAYTALSPSEISERINAVGTVYDGFYFDDAARVDGEALSEALRLAGQAYGLAFESGSVERIASPSQHCSVTLIDGSHFRGRNVIIAGGAWSGEFASQLEVSIPIQPVSGETLVLRDPEVDFATWPVVTPFRNFSFVPWPENRLAVGASRDPNSGFDADSTVDGVHQATSETLRVLPELGESTITEIRTGLRPSSVDDMPVIGPLPGHGHVFVATGHGSTGIKLGPYTGRLVSERIVRDSPVPEVVSPARFS